FQFLLEPVALLAEAVSLALDLLPLALGPLKLPPQALVLLPQPLGLALELFPRCRLPPPRHGHGSKKAYIGSRIYNAPRRGPLTDYCQPSVWVLRQQQRTVVAQKGVRASVPKRRSRSARRYVVASRTLSSLRTSSGPSAIMQRPGPAWTSHLAWMQPQGAPVVAIRVQAAQGRHWRGSPGPKSATIETPASAARCMGPESTATTEAARAITPTVSVRVVLPARFSSGAPPATMAAFFSTSCSDGSKGQTRVRRRRPPVRSVDTRSRQPPSARKKKICRRSPRRSMPTS